MYPAPSSCRLLLLSGEHTQPDDWAVLRCEETGVRRQLGAMVMHTLMGCTDRQLDDCVAVLHL